MWSFISFQKCNQSAFFIVSCFREWSDTLILCMSTTAIIEC